MSIKKLSLDACYLLLQSITLVFYRVSLFQLFQWKMSNLYKPFHSLRLFQQFQADCVYKKTLLRCLLLIVTVRFISFPLSFIVSVVSVEDVQSL